MTQIPQNALKPSLLAAIGAGALAVGLVAGAPASLVAPLFGFGSAGVAFEKVEGTIWRGAFRGVSVRGIALGDISFRLRPLALAAGRLAADVEARGGLDGAGTISAGVGGDLAVRGADIDFDLSSLREYSFLGEPIRGSVRIRIEEFAFSSRGCRAAEVALWSDVLVAPARRFDVGAMPLAGGAVCDGGDLLATLAGEGEEGAVSLALRVSPAMTWQLDAKAAPRRRELSEALQGFGFRQEDDMLTIGTRGAIRAAGV